MSLGEFRYWLAHGGDLEYGWWLEVWAMEREAEAEREFLARHTHANGTARPGAVRMPLG